MPAAMLLVATSTHAVSLGALEGSALIGRPLDVSVPVLLDAGSDPETSCARAEVSQGDGSADVANARIESAGGRQLLRVRSNKLVEEPVVTVQVHLGCFLKTTRRYVLFSDLPATPSDVAQAAPRLPVVTAAAQSAATPGAAGLPAQARRLPRPSSAQQAPIATAGSDAAAATPKAFVPGRTRSRMAPSQESAAAPDARLSTRLSPSVPAARASSRNRLKLDAPDLTVSAEPQLRMTMSIDTLPQVTPQQRTEATAVWKALNRSPTDVMQDYERMQSMSADLTVMRQHIVSNKAELDAMRAQVEKAEQDRDRITWALSAVAAALALLLAAALFYGRRERRARLGDEGWWQDSKLHEPTPDSPDAHLATKKQPALMPASLPGNSGLDFDLSAFGTEEARGPSRVVPPPAAGEVVSAFSNLDFQGSQPAAWRNLTSEELHDIQEQADFFVSLGDYDRAVNVLMSHVHASPQTSALAWMALLDLHHRLDRRQGYEGLRDQIERRMNVRIPEFDRYHHHTAGLEDYADIVERIVGLWPSQRVLDVIEDSIYRMPGGDTSEPLAMAAFHELLLLYNVGKLVVGERDPADIELVPEGKGEGNFPMTNVIPISAEISGPSDEDMAVLSTLLAGNRIDIDLDEAPAPKGGKGVKKFDANATLPGIHPDSANLIEFDQFEQFDQATSRTGKLN